MYSVLVVFSLLVDFDKFFLVFDNLQILIQEV